MDRYPAMFRVRQSFDASQVQEIDHAVWEQMDRLKLGRFVRPGQTVAITAGSRGIANIAQILRAAVQHLQRLGASPFLVPAMGSHGGATAEGQQELLASYGVTAEACGCPLRASMETVVLAEGAAGFPVHFDRHAAEADHVLVCGRVKPHTSFAGQYQSGLLKMMLIGLGKCAGASIYHRAADAQGFDAIVEDITPQVLQRGKILAGLAIIENAYDQTAHIEGVLPVDFLTREPELLTIARHRMPRLPFDQVDLLILDQIGKDISGSGMDTNVVGRKRYDHEAAVDEVPKIKRILVRGLSPASHGNGLGIGIAELCLERVVTGLDRRKMMINAITSLHLTAAMIPLSFATDREAIQAALESVAGGDPDEARVLWIRDTLHLQEVECSAAYWESAQQHTQLETLTKPRLLPFDDQGFLPRWMTDWPLD